MSVEFRQAGRLVTVTTALGPDVLLAEKLTGTEALSTPFSFELTAISKNIDIKASALVGSAATVTLDVGQGDGALRYVNGLIDSVTGGDNAGYGYRRYILRLTPSFQMLSHTRDCRIFQNKNAKEIISLIFNEYDIGDVDFSKLMSQYEKREYCVQYNESYFDFISRICEEEGIFYYFVHKNGSHVLTFGDSSISYRKCNPSSFEISPGNTKHCINSWRHRHKFVTGKNSSCDYNFETPQDDLKAEIKTRIDLPTISKYERFFYPGRYENKSQGACAVRTAMEGDEWTHDTAAGHGSAAALFAGGVFSITRHFAPSEDGKEWAITEIHHFATNASYFANSGENIENYENSFTSIPGKTVFRPQKTTPKPRIDGVQTAFVIGPDGKQVHVDRYGRIKVLFHWDRRGGKEEDACWIRTAQAWAGKNWGATTVPRIGMEVIVSFIDGDPDRPLVTGCVNNAQTMPAYELKPDETRTVLRTRSSPSGTGYNELRIEDRAGQEQIFIRAERDFHSRVKRERRDWVGADNHLHVSGESHEHVLKSRHEIVGGDHVEEINGGFSLTVDQDVNEKIGMNFVHKSGINTVIEAGVSISLKVGGNFITINPAGVFIKGNLVFINSGGAPAGLSASPEKPEKALAATDSKPGHNVTPPKKRRLPAPPPGRPPVVLAQVETMKAGAKSGAVGCEICQGKG
ncbi:MAG TPA: type VI secretion system tip protein TssI/VgrG [Azospirillaceae bacterium]|nr:type VI secretion system tip protein TssI/VgrG [Azospirillaceae bacterium]HRQ79889.1 type VI secretion system tip protein TssI/VgrG [Azospirillaceae bacterium]